MKQKYSHLTEENCLKIYECLLFNDSIPLIAKKLGYHKSTIYRELAGNSGKFGYRPDFACRQYAMRRRQKPGKIENNPELKSLILEGLKEGWSPDQISGRIKLKSGAQMALCPYSKNTYNSPIPNDLGDFLCHRHVKVCHLVTLSKGKRRKGVMMSSQ